MPRPGTPRQEAVRSRGLLVPDVSILSKPFELASLASAIRGVLDAAQSAIPISA